MGKSEEEIRELPPLPEGYKLVRPGVSKIPEQPQELSPLPEGYRLVTPFHPSIVPEEQLISPTFESSLEERLAQPIPGYQEEELIETPLPETPLEPELPIEPSDKWYTQFGRLGKSFQKGAFGASSKILRALDKASMALAEAGEKKLGIAKERLRGGIFEILADKHEYFYEKLEKEGASGIEDEVLSGLGGAAIDIPAIMTFGKWGLPIHGGVMGLAEGGPEGAAVGTLRGALIHKVIQGIGILPSVARLPAWAGFGAVSTPGGVKERTAGAITWTVLGMSGGNKKLTIGQFLENYPKISKKIGERKAREMLKRLAPEVTTKEVKEVGGPKMVLDEVVRELDKISEVEARELEQVELEPVFKATPGQIKTRIRQLDEIILESSPEMKSELQRQRLALSEQLRTIEKPTEKRLRTYPGFPKDAPDIWHKVMSHGGIARPKFEVEEFVTNVPKQLRRTTGLKPDDMSARLGFEDTGELYKALEPMRVKRITEKPEEVVRLEREEFLERQPEQEKILRTEADILKATGHKTKDIQEFRENEFLNGRELRVIVDEVIAGKRTKASAVVEVKGLIETTIQPPGVKKPIPEIGGEIWQKTRAEYVESVTSSEGLKDYKRDIELREKGEATTGFAKRIDAQHKRAVLNALADSPPKPVPPKVLADYPELEESMPIRMLYEKELTKEGEAGFIKLGREEKLRRIKEKGLYAEEKPKEKIEPLPKLSEAELEAARKAGLVKELPPSEKARKATFAEEFEVEKELPIKMISEKAITKGDEAGYIKVEAQKTFGDSIKTRAYQNLIDRFHSIKKLSDIVKKEGTELPPHRDPYIGIRNYLGVQGKAEAKIFYKRFKVDWRGNIHFKGESLKDILKPVKGRIDDFRRYLVDRRVPELAGRGIETGRNVEEAKKFIKENIREFEPHAKKFTEYMHSLLDELQEAGFLDKEALKVIKSHNQMYAPFQRVLDDIKKFGYVAASKKVLSKIVSPIRGIKGSKRQIIDPLESAIESTYRITECVERNRIANQIIDLRKISPEIAKIIRPVRPGLAVAVLEDGTRVYRPLSHQKEGIIEVLTDGDRHYYEVPKDLYDSMAQLDKVGYGWMTKILAAPARLLRTGATSTPEFAFRNPVRDQWFAFVNSKYGYIPGYDFAKGLFSLVKKPELYWKWKASGGEWSMLVTLDKATSQAHIKKVLGARDYKRYLKSPISFFEDISMMGEIPTRLGVFERAQGKVSDIEAAFQSREGSIDFARRGAKTKVVSALYTFANARLQAMDKLIRTAIERPIETLSKIIAISVIPSVINYLLNRDDPCYWEIPQWQRDLFWIIPIRRGTGVMGKKPIYLRIPKGDVGVIFGTSTEKILESIDKSREGKLELDKLAISIIKESMPISDIGGFLPVAARVPIELMANEKFFYGRPIISQGQERLEPREQYSPFTSETAKAIGKVFNISPAKIEHLITGYGAGMARYALKLNDGILGEMGVLPVKPERPKELADLPVIRAFTIRDPMGFGSESVQNFYETLDKIEKFSITEKILESRGKGKERSEYVRSHRAEFITFKRGLDTEFRRARADLSALRKIRDKALDSEELTADEKEQVMSELNALVMARIIPLLSKYRALEAMAKERSR